MLTFLRSFELWGLFFSEKSGSFRTMQNLTKTYEPEHFEASLYRAWEDAGCFQAKDQNAPDQEAFAMVIPPPNVTGVLHMGHALTNTIQDILVRWHRMKGDNTLWLPGTDHAGIATQIQVEKAIAREALSRHDLGREAFLKRTWQWVTEHGTKITEQLKSLGSSLDWSRERFTFDEGFSHSVKEVFVRLYEEGLIYRGERMIHWCPRCQTALSELEVIATEQQASFWYVAYEVVDGGHGLKKEDGTPETLVIATTRPETLLGDTAVFIHPEDPRYLKFHGKQVKLPLVGKILPILQDAYVDPTFGSGVLKVTPAHDFNDYELGKKHALAFVSVMDPDGKMGVEAGIYAGKTYGKAREAVVEDLKKLGHLVRVEEHQNSIGLCQRCDTPAQPRVSQQWFMKMASLAEPAIEAVRSGKVVFSPKVWEKTYFDWMDQIRDWCISRQLWWGHQIPAWYCDCGKVSVSREILSRCMHCHSESIVQDEDVLDTWFSSALWPFATLGWPLKTQALETFYPNAILETGFDIIFFWVARMMMLGMHFTGEVPFRRVYLHAMVRDEKGQKMSKSRGNVIDPLTVIEQYGADPLRWTLTSMAGQGRDIKLSLDRVQGSRAFCNKLWNAVRFFHFHAGVSEVAVISEWKGRKFGVLHQWILKKLALTIEQVERGLECFELHLSVQALYEFVWNEFCDWYLEMSKFLFLKSAEEKKEALEVLRYVLDQLLRLMHPFVPFITEKLWQSLLGHEPFLMLQSFPKPSLIDYGKGYEAVEEIRSVIQALRHFRGEHAISPQVILRASYRFKSEPSFCREDGLWVEWVEKLSQVRFEDGVFAQETVLSLSFLELRIFMDGHLDAQAEIKRLDKQLKKVDEDLAWKGKKLGDAAFLQKAPAFLVEQVKEECRHLEFKRKELRTSLDQLRK